MQQAPVLTSAADPASTAWQANEAAHRALADTLRGKLAEAARGGGERARARHTARGKLLPRERVAEIRLGVSRKPVPGARLAPFPGAQLAPFPGAQLAPVPGAELAPAAEPLHLRASLAAIPKPRQGRPRGLPAAGYSRGKSRWEMTCVIVVGCE